MKKYFLIFFLILLHSCSQKSEEVKTKVEGDSLEIQMIEAYNDGVKALDMGDALFAAKNLMRQNYFILNPTGHRDLP